MFDLDYEKMQQQLSDDLMKEGIIDRPLKEYSKKELDQIYKDLKQKTNDIEKEFRKTKEKDGLNEDTWEDDMNTDDIIDAIEELGDKLDRIADSLENLENRVENLEGTGENSDSKAVVDSLGRIENLLDNISRNTFYH